MHRHPYFPSKIRHIPTKRIFDVFFSLSVLTLLAPLMFLIAIAVAISTGSWPLYRHERIGRGGRPFQCYKFRTMPRDADTKLEELFEERPYLKKEWEEKRKLKVDPRVTPLGQILRKSSLDELPQFWNVLMGHLSVVGPRAVMMEEIETYFQSKAQKILTIRPGVTGLWQISGRNDTTYGKRIFFDETYVERRNLAMDLKIVAKTIPLFFSSRGAY